MKRYWIKNKEGQYWSVSKMKPSHLPDIPNSYTWQGYWSNYTDEYAIKHRLKRIWLFHQPERIMMKLFGNINTKLEVVT